MLPAAVTVTTVAAPQVLVAPVVLAAPVAVSIAGDAVTVSPVVVITDVDSSDLQSATVTVSGGDPGDVLGWTLPAGWTGNTRSRGRGR